MLSNQTTTFPLSNWDRFVVALARYLAAHGHERVLPASGA
jgi:hypothetical protein